MRRVLVFALALVALAAPAFAQTSVAVDIDKAVLAWDWVKGTGGDVAEFRVKCGTAAGTYTMVTTVGDPAARSVPVRTVVGSVGSYFCVVTAANQFGESGPSNEVAFQAGTAPSAPTSLRLQAQ